MEIEGCQRVDKKFSDGNALMSRYDLVSIITCYTEARNSVKTETRAPD